MQKHGCKQELPTSQLQVPHTMTSQMVVGARLQKGFKEQTVCTTYLAQLPLEAVNAQRLTLLCPQAIVQQVVFALKRIKIERDSIQEAC